MTVPTLSPTGNGNVPDQPLSQVLDGAMAGHARHGRTALVDERGSLSYHALRGRVDAVAAQLLALRLPEAATVGIVAAKDRDTVVAALALLRAGHCVCVLDPRLAPGTVADRVAAFDIAHLLVGRDELETLTHTPLRAWTTALPTTALPTTASRAVEPTAPSGGAVDPARPALMLFTSGSTGTPKAIRLTEANVLAHAAGVIEHTGLTPADRLLHLMPLLHTNGINTQVLAPLLAGASIALVPRFRSADVDDQIERYEPTILTAVPTMYLRMLAHHRRRSTTLRMLRCGSAPLTTAQHDQIEAAYGVPLVQSYGLSEATCTSAMNPPAAPRRGTVGTVLAHQQVRIIEPGTDRDAAPGTPGEVCIGGPTVMAGYYGAAPGDGPVREGLLHTGDLGCFDEDGYLMITGRLKDVVIRGGENLAPAAIEGALTSHPAVVDAAVIGAAHHDLGEVPVAYVVPATLDDPPDVEELRGHVTAVLSRIHTPERITYVPDLPVNSVGKVDKKALRRQDEAGTS